MFYFNFRDFQIIGASPEILVRLRNNVVTISPVEQDPVVEIKKKTISIKKIFYRIKKKFQNILCC